MDTKYRNRYAFIEGQTLVLSGEIDKHILKKNTASRTRALRQLRELEQTVQEVIGELEVHLK